MTIASVIIVFLLTDLPNLPGNCIIQKPEEFAVPGADDLGGESVGVIGIAQHLAQTLGLGLPRNKEGDIGCGIDDCWRHGDAIHRGRGGS